MIFHFVRKLWLINESIMLLGLLMWVFLVAVKEKLVNACRSRSKIYIYRLRSSSDVWKEDVLIDYKKIDHNFVINYFIIRF